VAALFSSKLVSHPWERRQTRRTFARHALARRIGFEPLEERNLLAGAAPTAVDELPYGVFQNGTLFVDNTPPHTFELLVAEGAQVHRRDLTTGADIAVWEGTIPNGQTGSFMAYGPDGHLYAGAAGDNVIRRFHGSSGALLDVFTSGASLSEPRNLAFGPDGNLYVADKGADAVLRFDFATGAFINVFASGIADPVGLAFGADGHLYVSSAADDNVQHFNPLSGALLGVFASGGGLDAPQGIAFGPDGNLYVSGQLSGQVHRYNGQTGQFIDAFSGVSNPQGLVFTPDGRLLVANYDSGQVLAFNPATRELLGTLVDSNSVVASITMFHPIELPFGVLDNDSDPENDPLTAILVEAPTHGTLTLNPDGTFKYVPTPGFLGEDSFLYVANDGASNSAPAKATIFTYIPDFAVPTPISIDNIGLFAPSPSTFFLRNAQAAGPADIRFNYGPPQAGWTALAGDWDGDGVDSIGLYNSANGAFFLRNTNSAGVADVRFQYGPGGQNWLPVVGDWDEDGVDTVGLYNATSSVFYLKNSNSAGPANQTFGYGPAGAGWLPIVGDWNNDGVETVGLYNPTTSVFFLRNQHAAGPADLRYQYGPANAGWLPMAGDWNGDGTDTLGLYSPGTSGFFLRNAHNAGPADVKFVYGPAGQGWLPLAGDWNGPSSQSQSVAGAVALAAPGPSSQSSGAEISVTDPSDDHLALTLLPQSSSVNAPPAEGQSEADSDDELDETVSAGGSSPGADALDRLFASEELLDELLQV